MSEKKKNQDQELQNVENALSSSEKFIEKYRNQLLYGVGAIILIVLAILAVKSWYIAPREAKAQNKIAICQEYFARDSFYLALKGDGTEEFVGFENIAKNYSFTKTSSLASAYAGVCNYRLGDYKTAINYLKKFDLESVNITPAVIGLIGDCYVETGDYKTALKYFAEATKKSDSMLSPYFLKKSGIIYEKMGNYDKAIEAYKSIEQNYFNSSQAADIQKYIERAEALR